MDVEQRTARFEEFFSAEYPRLVTVLYAVMSDRHHAEDVAQETLAKAHRRWDDLSRYDNPAAWIRRVALNATKNRWRDRRREVAALERIHAVDVEDHGIVHLPDNDLWAAVRSLPRQQRGAVALYYVDDLSIEDIAASLGCSAGSVKTHLSRARSTLAKQLANEQGQSDG